MNESPSRWTPITQVTAAERSEHLWRNPKMIYRIIDSEGEIHAPGWPTCGIAGTLVAKPAVVECNTDARNNVAIQRLSVEGLRS